MYHLAKAVIITNKNLKTHHALFIHLNNEWHS